MARSRAWRQKIQDKVVLCVKCNKPIGSGLKEAGATMHTNKCPLGGVVKKKALRMRWNIAVGHNISSMDRLA